jgi:hypothetical protein
MINDSDGSASHRQPYMGSALPEDTEQTIPLGLSRTGADRNRTKD